METINLLGAICSILTVLSGIITFIKKPDHFKLLFYCVFLFLCLALLGSLALIYQYVKSPYSNNLQYLYWGIGILILSGIILFFYGRKAYYSLENDGSDILPPKLLWQMAFNKLESRITNPSNTKFAVVSMDDSEAVKDSVNKIKERYNKGGLYEIVSRNGYKKNGNKLLFTLDKVQKEKYLSGVIFLIGPAADDDQSLKEIKKAIEDFSYARREVPIGYIKTGNRVDFDLHFEEISSERLDNCIHNLIMRGYTRSRMQFELSSAYHNWFWIGGGVIATLCIGMMVSDFLGSKELDNKINEHLRTKPLVNAVYNLQDTSLWANCDIKLIQNDDSLQKTLNEVSCYYFSDLDSFLHLKIWMKKKNNLKNPCIVCIIILHQRMRDFNILFLWIILLDV